MITYELYTDKGSRGNNEDFMGMASDDAGFFFAVADGLGGHDKGEVASRLVVESSMQSFYERENHDFLGQAVWNAQERLMQKQKSERAFGKMKTTYTGLYIHDNLAQWIHVGDSRGYYFDRHHMKKRTLDHSVPQMLVQSGQIREKDIRNHPDRNRLLYSMGSEWEEKQYELGMPISLKKHRQAFLLCSDGFWELITEKEMSQCLKASQTVGEWMQAMVALIKEHGQGKDMDNFTAIAVFVEKDLPCR